MRERLEAFRDGELERSEAARIEQHVSECQSCFAEVSAVDEIASCLSRLPKAQLKRDIADNFQQILQERKTKQKDNVVAPKRGFYIAAAAAAILLMVFAGRNIVQNAFNQQTVATRDESLPTKPLVADQATPDQREIERKHPAANTIATGKEPLAVPSKDTSKQGLPEEAPKVVAKKVAPLVLEPDKQSNQTPVAEQPFVKNQITQGRDLVALYDDDNNLADDLGFSTDEDGLYAIKL